MKGEGKEEPRAQDRFLDFLDPRSLLVERLQCLVPDFLCFFDDFPRVFLRNVLQSQLPQNGFIFLDQPILTRFHRGSLLPSGDIHHSLAQ